MDKAQRFVKMFLNDIGRIHNLTGNSLKLLLIIVNKMQYDNMFIAKTSVRKEIADSLSVTGRTLYNLLGELVKSGLLVKDGSNVYRMDPETFAHRHEQKINFKRINYMKIRYGDEGRTFEVGEEA